MATLSPMMTKYLETKEEYPDCILFYRLGDFYEMFFEDAVLVSKELELTLTGKDCGLEERAPMCGVPYHALDTYLNRLVLKGYKVAIAEQVEDPKKAKGLVKREVIRVVTPGTITSSMALIEDKNNYLMCIAYIGDKFGICITDISTGECFITKADNTKQLYDEINRFTPSEILYNSSFLISGIDIENLKATLGITFSSLDNIYFTESLAYKIIREHFNVSDTDGLGLLDFPESSIACGALLQYIYDTQKTACSQITHISIIQNGEYMVLDTGTRRNLELIETMREKKKSGSLLGILDKTKTAMGARLLRRYIEQPLIDMEKIKLRLDAVEELSDRYIDREEFREYLSPIYDLERLIGRISSKAANTKDLLAFNSSIKFLPAIKTLLSGFQARLFKDINEDMDALEDIAVLIDMSINEDSPLSLKDGDIIKSGYNSDIDTLRSAKLEGKNWLAKLESTEREKTGIKGLKIKYNKVFGYYFEVTNSFKNLVPDYYIRKQTLTNAERYTIDELKRLEDMILGAEDKLNSLEYEVFVEIRDKIAAEVNRIQLSAKSIAKIDALVSLATVATKNNYIRPKINNKGIIEIKAGRHPVVETMIGEDKFIKNDVYLDNTKQRFSIITGPNMAGKSTYMRQVALIVLMAQMGSFIPAESANICICDRIFTRVGASDDLASGKSTFMVEMTEVANILRNATKNSLIILDEIGRGTSTFDGLSIAWAVVEHIANNKLLGAKSLFATHYHELTELEGTLDGVNNYCIAVKEDGEDIVFLRKIVKGGADKSYGIQVAKLAGIPDAVLKRARELLEDLSFADIANKAREIAASGSSKKNYKPVKKQTDLEAFQLSIFDTVRDDDIITEIRDIELSMMTPIDALNTLYKLQNKIKNRI